MSIVTVLRVIIRLFPLVLVAWIVQENLAPFGSITLRCTATHCDPQLANFASKEPEVLIGTTKDNARESYRRITNDPLYVDATLFRPMRRATVRLTYQNPEVQPRLRVGVLGKGIGFEFQDLADHQPLLTNLLVSPEWTSVQEGDLVLFRHDRPEIPVLSTIHAFFADFPTTARVATHQLDLATYVQIKGYAAAVNTTTLPFGLYGKHTFLFYVGNSEPLDVRFTLREQNEQKGADDMALQVFRGNDLIVTTVIPDDGDAAASKKRSTAEHRVFLENLDEGTYRVEIVAKGEEPGIPSVTSRQKLMVIPKRVILDSSNRPVTLTVREGTFIKFSAHGNDDLQTIAVGKRTAKLTKVGSDVTVPLERSDAVEVTVPKGGILIESDGYFSAAPQNFISTLSLRADAVPDTGSLDRYDYIAAHFPAPVSDGSWLIAQKTIEDLPQTRTVNFLIVGDPPLGQTHRALRVKELEITLEGDPLTPRTIMGLAQRLLDKIR